MTTDFILRMGISSTEEATWWSGERSGRGTLAEAAQAAAGGRVTVLLPAASIHLDTARIPTRQRRRLREALPYALEERIADDVEGLHFAHTIGEGETIHVAAVARGSMGGWMAALAGVGIAPARALPDVLALPLPAEGWSLLLEDDGFLLRTGRFIGVAAEIEVLEPMFVCALEEAGAARPGIVHIHDARRERSPLPLAEWCAPFGVGLHEEAAADAIRLLASGVTTPAIDLLQGEFSPRVRIDNLWRPWRTAAALAGLLVVLHVVSGAWRHVALDREVGRTEQEIEQIYRTTFPDAQRIVNARVQMQQRLDLLRRGEGGQEFARMMTRLAPALRHDGIEIQALRYAPGTVEIDLQSTDFQRLDDVRRKLEAGGRLTAEVGNAVSDGDQVRGRVTIREVGA